MFLITWTDEAFDQMHRLVLQHPKRNWGLSQALKLAQARLGTDPLGCSESREDQNRVCFLKPLTVDFEDDTVDITQVFFSLKS